MALKLVTELNDTDCKLLNRTLDGFFLEATKVLILIQGGEY